MGKGPRHVLVIVNPAAGRRRRARLDGMLRRLDELGCPAEVWPTRTPGDAEALGRRSLAHASDVTVAAGGDGTINEVINGMAGSPRPLAILPLGTANVLAAEIGLPTDPRRVAEIVAGGPARPVCLGRVGARYFIAMAGVGFDARVVAGVNLRLKRAIGKGAYLVQALGQLARYRPTLYEVEMDGAIYRAASVIVANGRFYAGRFVCAPEARIETPRLHVCLFERPGRRATLGYAAALALGRLGRRSDYKIIETNALKIRGPAGDPIQIDGDLGARLPAEVALAPERLMLVMPM